MWRNRLLKLRLTKNPVTEKVPPNYIISIGHNHWQSNEKLKIPDKKEKKKKPSVEYFIFWFILYFKNMRFFYRFV